MIRRPFTPLVYSCNTSAHTLVPFVQRVAQHRAFNYAADLALSSTRADVSSSHDIDYRTLDVTAACAAWLSLIMRGVPPMRGSPLTWADAWEMGRVVPWTGRLGWRWDRPTAPNAKSSQA